MYHENDGEKCDYTICGDRDEYLKEHPEYHDEYGYSDLKAPPVSRIFRLPAKFGDSVMKMQIVRLDFGGAL